MAASLPALRTLVAQISDTHIRRPGELAYGIVDTAAALQRCVTFLNGLPSQPDILVVSGDLVDFGREEEYAHFRKLMAPLSVPYVVLPGNHDERNAMRRAFSDQPCFSTAGPMNACVSANDIYILLLDSTVPGQPYGILSDETLRWLNAELQEHPTRPTLIFLHHPPFLTGIRHMDVQNLRNADELGSVLQRHPQVRLVATGMCTEPC